MTETLLVNVVLGIAQLTGGVGDTSALMDEVSDETSWLIGEVWNKNSWFSGRLDTDNSLATYWWSDWHLMTDG